MLLISNMNVPTNLSFTATKIITSTSTPLLQPPALSSCLLSLRRRYDKTGINITCNNSKSATTTPTTLTVDDFSSYNNQPKVGDNKEEEEEKFDWYAQWYPVVPVCDLDKTKPHAKRVIGLDVVVWWDRNESQWKVFNDMCPHRLAPLSEGRIDPSGRLQCIYHGWCFNGSGDCKLIPQAPIDGPPVHASKKACVSVYPSIVQNQIVWFWPNSDIEFKDILQKKQPPFLRELDDPTHINYMSQREFNYGYEVLIENIMDPSHVPYTHYGILPLVNQPPPEVTVDREGGGPLELSVKDMNINGFRTKEGPDSGIFIAPCTYYTNPEPEVYDNELVPSGTTNEDAPAKPKGLIHKIFFCVPVSPGKSRLIAACTKQAVSWIDRVFPRWLFHVMNNLVLDSDLYLLHVQEQKIMALGPTNWHKSYYVPTKCDSIPVGYRRWLNKYSGGQFNWGSKFNGGALPPTPPREELLDRYWTHVVNCSSCRVAYKRLNMAETALQVIAFGLIGVGGLTRQGTVTTIQRSAIFAMALLCFAASKWLSRFIYKSFHFHDYDHAHVVPN